MTELADALDTLSARGLLERITALKVGDVALELAPETPRVDPYQAIREQPRTAEEAAEKARSEWEATMYAASEGLPLAIPTPIDVARATRQQLRKDRVSGE